MQAKQAGFSLIELLIVIVVQGILASFVVPQIGDLVEHSRIAKIQALSSSIKVAATMANAQQTAEKLGASGEVRMNGYKVSMTNRYPSLNGISLALAEYQGFSYNSATGEFTLDNAGASAGGACSVTYTAADGLGEPPIVSTNISNCK